MANLGKIAVTTAVVIALQGCVGNKTMVPSFAGKSYSTTSEALHAATEYYDNASSVIESRSTPLIDARLNTFNVPTKEFEKSVRARNYRHPITNKQVDYLSKVDNIFFDHFIGSIKKRNTFSNIVEVEDPLFDLSITPAYGKNQWLLYPSIKSNQEIIFTLRAPSGVEKEITLDKGAATASGMTADFINKFETAASVLNQSKEAPKISKISGEWEVISNKDPITDQNIVVAGVRAKSTSNEQMLYIRCDGGKVQLYIDFNEFLGTRSIPLTYRLDKELALTDHWGISTNNKAVFYPYNAKNFMYKVFGASQLAVRATPYGENTRTVVFNIEGLSQALLKYKNTCDY